MFMFMFSILKNKTPKTISHQISTPLKRLAFSLLMAFSLFSYSANATEIKPIAFSTGIDISEGTAGTVVILTYPDHPATTVFSNTFVNTVKVPLSPVSISEGPITSLAIRGAAGTVVTISDTGGNFWCRSNCYIKRSFNSCNKCKFYRCKHTKRYYSLRCIYWKI